MSRVEGASLIWGARILLASLVVANGMLLVLLRTGGPLIGVVFYAVLLVVAYRGSDLRAVMVGGLVGLGVHMAEVAMMGWSRYPILMALSLILPAALALVAWSAGQRAYQD